MPAEDTLSLKMKSDRAVNHGFGSLSFTTRGSVCTGSSSELEFAGRGLELGMNSVLHIFKRRGKATTRKSEIILLTAFLCDCEEVQFATHSLAFPDCFCEPTTAFKVTGYVLEQFGVTEKLNGRHTEFYKWLTYLFSPQFPVTNILQLCGSVVKTSKPMLTHNY